MAEAGPASHFATCFQAPDSYASFEAAGDEVLLIGKEVQGGDLPRMPFHSHQFPPGDSIPNDDGMVSDRPTLVSDRQQLSVARTVDARRPAFDVAQ
jgi:hypothetical protein